MYVIGHNCKAKHGGQCVFPFIYGGKSYDKCTTEGHDQPWCSTKVDEEGNHIGGRGNWGNCNETCSIIDGKYQILNKCQCFNNSGIILHYQ